MKYLPINDTIKHFASIFTKNGFSLYIVGGAVRDYILDMEIEDYDFTTEATPEEVISMFKTTIPTGIKHGTVTVLFEGNSFEVTTFRNDFDYLDGRRPEKVEFIRSLDEDLKRRDFTINALAADATTGLITDNHNGIADLKKKIIKAIGIADQRFEEDGLRIMRACRFASKLDFEVEEKTKIAMKEKSSNIKNVSQERIKDELFKLLDGKSPQKGLNLLYESSVLDIILPELAELKNLKADGPDKIDAFEHTLYCIQAAAKHNYPTNVRLAALFHDIGKASKEQTESNLKFFYTKNSYCFYNHEKISEDLTKSILVRLKASNETIDRVCNLVGHHMFNYSSFWSDGAIKRFINRVGYKNINDLFKLRMCNLHAKYDNASWESLQEFEERIDKIISRNEALSLKDLDINGQDLINLGIQKGPLFSQILNFLLNAVLENPKLNERYILLDMANNFYKSVY